ncbi:serine/threonine phosphatase [Synergistales bacterium]|nr:serine/threonine phosphatase [Synergistales bacterium]
MVQSVLAFFVASNIYIYLKLRLGFAPGAWNLIYICAALIGAVLPFASRAGILGSGRAGEVIFVLSFTWLAIVGLACLGFFILDMGTLGAWIIDAVTGASLRARFFAPRKCVRVTLVVIILTVLYSFYEAWNVRRVDVAVELASPGFGGMERLRIALLTDVHLGGVYTLNRLERAMAIVRDSKPDIFLIGGDLVDGNMDERLREAELLRGSGAKYGAFAVTGNHDFYSGVGQAVEFMKRAGLTVLRDERTEVAGITLIGLDDPVKMGRGFSEEILPEGIDFSRKNKEAIILLKHRPYVIAGTEGKFDLQLSGHTHGGQIWPFIYVASRVNKSVQGLSKHGDSLVYVSNGTGFWGPPMRFFAPPEVTIIDISSSR